MKTHASYSILQHPRTNETVNTAVRFSFLCCNMTHHTCLLGCHLPDPKPLRQRRFAVPLRKVKNTFGINHRMGGIRMGAVCCRSNIGVARLGEVLEAEKIALLSHPLRQI